jgi:FkbM family methyltransferase
MDRTIARRMRHYADEIVCYAREAASLRDFRQIMRARLSLSKVGPLVARRRQVVVVRLRSFRAPISLRTHSTDISVLKELLLARTYDGAVEQSASGTEAIVDLGANTGLATCWLAARFPAARILAVEPEPDNVRLLRLNAGALGDRVTVVAACAGSRRRRVSLASSTGAWGYRMRESGGGDGASEVDVVPMATLLAEHGFDHVDLLKCDVEGAERELFEDAGAWLPSVDVAVVECHDGYTTDELRADAARGGVRTQVVRHDAEPALGLETVTLRRVP